MAESHHHIVKLNDTLSGISKQYNLTLIQLLRANRALLDGNPDAMIYPGDWINVPEAITPDPPPSPTPKPDIADVFGIRTQNDRKSLTAAWFKDLGRETKFWRETGDQYENSATAQMWTKTESWWNVQFAPSTDDERGLFAAYPNLCSVFMMPSITAMKGVSLSDKIKRHNQVIDGNYDEKLKRIIRTVSSNNRVHCWGIGSEGELSNWTFTKHDIPEDLWIGSFERIATLVHEAGHYVVYNGNGPMFELSNKDATRMWWEYSMPDLKHVDVIGCDIYVGPGISPTKRIMQAEQVCDLAYELKKRVGISEYGIRDKSLSDKQRIDWHQSIWNVLEQSKAEVDHLIFWDHQESVATPGERSAIVDRMAA